MSEWFYVALNNLTFAVEIKNKVVRTCPAPQSWAVGKQKQFVLNYWKRKGAIIKKLKVK